MQTLKRIYRRAYAKCPQRVKGRLTDVVSRLPGKPSAKLCPVPVSERFPAGFKGALVVSADFEMAWAWRYAKTAVDPVAIGLRERANVPDILRILDEFRIPVSWATVGHLFLQACGRENGLAHEELARIPFFTNRVWTYQSGDWFDHDPCSDVEQDPAWYAPDLVRAVMGAPAGHEIACHTFTHLDCTDVHCPPAVMEDEIKACIKLARDFGVDLKSMVFPGGTNGNYAVLKKYGFTNVRLNAPYDMFYPEKDDSGLWLLPSSTSIDNHGFGWSAEQYRRYYARYLDKAIDANTVCHLWFHPSIDAFCLESIFPVVFHEARKRADQGDLWIVTMRDLADYCERNIAG